MSVLSALDRVAVLRAKGDPNGPLAMQSLERSTPQLGVKLLPVDFAAAGDLDAVFAQMREGEAQTLIVGVIDEGERSGVAASRNLRSSIACRPRPCSRRANRCWPAA